MLQYGRLINLNEKRVIALLERYLSANHEFCKCEGCVTDIIAMTLNQIPAHYSVQGNTYEYAYIKVTDSEILRHIAANAKIVKENPKHCLRK